MVDIYFEPNYGKLYEKIEGGISTLYEFKGGYGKVHHLFIKREINIAVDDTIWYDLITPYGYGGPIITECEEGNEKLLVGEFNKSFQQYCIENNIVSEFIRFHPICDNAMNFNSMYDVSYIRKTVGTKINNDEDFMISEFSKSTRKSIRRALKSGVTYRITENPHSIETFKEIYYSTMDRNNASVYYYFDDDYFNECLRCFRKNILYIEVLYDDKPIAAAFYFVYGNTIHAHLSGTLEEYLKLSPAYVIKYATATWARENDIKLIHYGGGTTNSEDDMLYKFKKKFTEDTIFKFHVGKKIWNKDIYEKLCNKKNVDEESDFFPLYRKV